MPVKIDFLIQFFSFSTGVGILLIYAYWQWVAPDRRIRWAMVVLASVIANYFLGLYAYLLESDFTTHFPVYIHFAVQLLTLLGLFLGLQRLLFLIGAKISRWEVAVTWVCLAVMAASNMAARVLERPPLLPLSSVFFMVVGLLFLFQFWQLKPEKPPFIQIRRLALIGLSLFVPAFILQSLLPEALLKVHPVDAIAYLYVIGCALWVALNSLFKYSSPSASLSPNVNPIDMAVAQRQFDLTEREYQVLQLLVQAKPYKVIAQELSISLHTVKSHASNIYRKTGAKGKSDLKYRFRSTQP